MPLWLRLAIAVIGFGALGVLITSFPDSNDETLQWGTFLVLTLTLVVLLRYAYDTFLMASVTKMRWDEESILATDYEMSMAEGTQNIVTPHVGFQVSERVMFTLVNRSKAFLRVRVWCDFKIYGEPVDLRADLSGRAVWYVYPRQSSRGWFLLSSVLALKGKAIADMVKERSAENRAQQLTMDLRIEFRAPELNRVRELPPRRHFFDFDQWAWIPELTIVDDST